MPILMVVAVNQHKNCSFLQHVLPRSWCCFRESIHQVHVDGIWFNAVWQLADIAPFALWRFCCRFHRYYYFNLSANSALSEVYSSSKRSSFNFGVLCNSKSRCDQSPKQPVFQQAKIPGTQWRTGEGWEWQGVLRSESSTPA